ATFMRGFREVIGLAVVVVAVYLLLNAVVIGSGLFYLLRHPEPIATWYEHLREGQWYISHQPIQGTGILTAIGISILFFPKLALGLSGFETGVAVMPLIRGDATDTHDKPEGRIHNARKLLATAAGIMSVYLLGSAIVTATLIPPQELLKTEHLTSIAPKDLVDGTGGRAADRALAFLAHGEGPHAINPLFGEAFGTLYD